ncbi:uncharacterized protein LOC132627419 [Lycium barbarum]|uniref:uncharacterized protein LOC132627419 n=1 Tax=Lycium barbarum TaxID=112863 RepID=UPI00293E07A1|nr:uncharacterized protein LOC132627419 [Lycium barbarum]
MANTGNPFPYPSTLNIANFVTIKLFDSSNYVIWKAQMLCLLESQELVGFIDGTIQPPLDKITDYNGNQDNNYLMWKRSDRLVKGWILGSLTEKMLEKVVEKISARDLWLELEDICCAKSQDQYEEAGSTMQPTIEEEERVESVEDYRHCLTLYRAARRGDWEAAQAFLHENLEANRVDLITSSLQTALHIAIGLKNDNACNFFIENLVDSMSDDALAIQNSSGETALHYAARFGNLLAANILVKRNHNLPHVASNKGLYPIHLATEYGYKSLDMVRYFFSVTKSSAPYTGIAGARLLRRLIRSDLYELAVGLVNNFPDLAKCGSDELLSPLALLATKISVFTGESRPSSRKRLSWIQKLLFISSTTFLEPAVGLKQTGYKNKKHHDGIKLAEILCEKLESLSEKEIDSIVGGPLLQAARFDNYKLLEIIVTKFPSSVYYCDTKGKTALHVAVENRSRNVFNLIYRMSEHRHILMSSMDHHENTILHLAGKLLPENKLNRSFGPALQMQQELQWFKEVKKVVPPSYYDILNSEGKTANEVFTERHVKLKREGEEWLKDTANGCSLIAALVATIAFAAAVTVPGGNDEDNGFPIFSRNGAFTLFALSNGISLFTSSTSLLAFVSILTSRKAEEDFLHALPDSLSMGLHHMIASISFMTISFCATLYLVLIGKNRWLLLPLTLFALFPIAALVRWLFPLFSAVSSSTLVLGIFRKKNKAGCSFEA